MPAFMVKPAQPDGKMSMRDLIRRGIGILAVLLAAGNAAAAAEIPAATTEKPAAGPIRFGAILPMSGPRAETGTQQMLGLQFAADGANAAGGVGGSRIEIVFEDDQAKPTLAIRSFNRLVDQQHVKVIFTTGSGPALAMAPLATRRKILLVNIGAQADRLATASPYLVSTLPAFADEVQVLSRYLIGEGRKRAAILFANDRAGTGERDDFVKYFPAAGGTIVSQDQVRPGQTDFRPALLKLAAANPDVMLVAVRSNLRPMAQQYRQLGLHFTVAGTTSFAEAGAIADPSAEGFVHTKMRTDIPPDMAAGFKAKFSEEMGFYASQSCNAAQIVLAVIGKVVGDGEAPTGQTLRDTLFALGRFQFLTSVAFNANSATVPLDINVVTDGKDVTVKRMSPG
jgi:branched-chain amino acid transport system substrate-binding protein